MREQAAHDQNIIANPVWTSDDQVSLIVQCVASRPVIHSVCGTFAQDLGRRCTVSFHGESAQVAVLTLIRSFLFVPVFTSLVVPFGPSVGAVSLHVAVYLPYFRVSAGL